jgi:hypothetical protein
MAKYLQASLILLVSIAIAALIVVAVLPAHARGDATEQAKVPGITPAVLVEHLEYSQDKTAQTCPALEQPASGTSCPYLAGMASKDGRHPQSTPKADRVAESACPYLSSLAASSGCPALPTQSEGTGCPYLSGKDQSDSSPQSGEAEKAPKTLKL